MANYFSNALFTLSEGKVFINRKVFTSVEKLTYVNLFDMSLKQKINLINSRKMTRNHILYFKVYCPKVKDPIKTMIYFTIDFISTQKTS